MVVTKQLALLESATRIVALTEAAVAALADRPVATFEALREIRDIARTVAETNAPAG